MQINTLNLNHVRNLVNTKLSFSPRLNIIYGDNAAGKSSLLEALYILGNGRSFRTAKHSKVIQDDKTDYTLFSQLNSNGSLHKLGLSRERNGDVVIKLNSEPIKRLSSLVKLFPVQMLSPEQYDLLTKGPSARRKQLDWGVFHVEHSVLSYWQKCHKILQHRNNLLKRHADYVEVSVWDKQLVDLSEKVTQLRRAYCAKIEPLFQSYVQRFLGSVEVELKLYPGWTEKDSMPLERLYEQQFEKDLKLGFTQYSIQKADLKFMLPNNKRAADYLSRGQQKLLIVAFKMAQLSVMQQHGEQPPLFLLDDIGAELDVSHQEQLLEILAEQPENQQIFITCVHLDPLKSLIKRYNEVKVFHVEHGSITSINEFQHP